MKHPQPNRLPSYGLHLLNEGSYIGHFLQVRILDRHTDRGTPPPIITLRAAATTPAVKRSLCQDERFRDSRLMTAQNPSKRPITNPGANPNIRLKKLRLVVAIPKL